MYSRGLYDIIALSCTRLLFTRVARACNLDTLALAPWPAPVAWGAQPQCACTLRVVRWARIMPAQGTMPTSCASPSAWSQSTHTW